MSEPQAVRIGAYDVTLRDIDLPRGIRISLVQATGGSLTLARDPFRAESEESGRVRIEITESDLTEFVGKNPPSGMRDISIRLTDGVVHFEAVKTVLIDLKAKATCSLRIVDEKAVYIELLSVDVAGVGLRQFVQSHIDKINPVVSADALPIPALLQKIEIADGKLTLWGTVDVRFSAEA